MAATGSTRRGERATPAAWAGLSLLLAPGVHALELGELAVTSRLGQPLAAMIPVRLAAGESLAAGCVRSGTDGDGLAAVPGATLVVPVITGPADTVLRVASERPLFEPVYALSLRVACPGAPVIVRQYVLMLDLPGAAVPSAPESAPPDAAVRTDSPPAPDVLPAGRGGADLPVTRPARMETDSESLTPEARYVVRPGDTLWMIARRVRGRDTNIWATANAILAANPGAFIDGNPDRLRAGATLAIPASVGKFASDLAPPARSPGVVVPPDARTDPLPVPAAAPAEAPTPAPVAVPGAGTAVMAPEIGESASAKPPVPAGVARSPAPAEIRRAATPRPDAPARGIAGRTDEPNPLTAALSGLAFGLVLSAALWSRRVRGLLRPAPAVLAPGVTEDDPSRTAAMPLHLGATPRPEPAISVSFEPSLEEAFPGKFAAPGVEDSDYADPFATAFGTPAVPTPRGPGDEITAELEELFNVPAGLPRGLDDETTALPKPLSSPPAARRDELPDPVDVGEPDDDRGLVAGSGDTVTAEQPRAVAPLRDDAGDSATIDLHALARSASENGPDAQTLREALTLLEQDYEAELTASQVLDTAAIRAALGDEALEGTARRRRP